MQTIRELFSIDMQWSYIGVHQQRSGQRKWSFWRIEHFKNCGHPDPSKAKSWLTQLSGRQRKAILQEGGRLGFLRTSCLGFALIAGLGNLPAVWKLSENSEVLVSFENLKRAKLVFLKQQLPKKQKQKQQTNLQPWIICTILGTVPSIFLCLSQGCL